MKVRSPINIRAKSQADRSTYNENLGEGSNEALSPTLLYVWLKGLRIEWLRPVQADQTCWSNIIKHCWRQHV